MIHLLLHVIKFLGWVAEHFPDDPRLGWKCLLGGTLLAAAIFVPERFVGENLALYVIQILSLITGIVCFVLGLFVFFRRAVWRLQDRREKRTISLFNK